MGEIAEAIKIEIPIESIDKTSEGVSSATRNLEKMEQAVSKFDQVQKKTQKSLLSWAKEKYQILLDAKDKVSPILSQVHSGLKTVGGKAWNITMRAIDYATSPIRGIINLLRNPVFQVGAVLGISVGFKDTIDTFSDFEAAMSQVKAISGASGIEFEDLTDKAKEMGANTKFTATESAEAFNYMAMAGWKTKDMLDGIEGIMSLAAASGEDLATTSDIVTDALTAFGMKASESGHFADVLAQASANANTNVGMLGESFKYIAPVAGAMKYTVEDVSLALGLMANASVKGTMAGTALKTALANMAAPTDKMAKAMDAYGISLTDDKGKMKTFKDVLDNIRGSLGGLAEAEQTAAASTIFGKEAMAGMLAIINASEADYKKLADAVYEADGASKEMADTMLDNLQGSLTLLQSAADGVKIALGERVSPYIRRFADSLTNNMPDIEAWFDGAMDKIDKFSEKISEMTGTERWQKADFFEKVNIAWDEIIGMPFQTWWNTDGKETFTEAANDIGKWLGTGISSGILAILGVDVGGATSDGINIGKSFAEGFAAGFDSQKVKEAIKQTVSGIFKDSVFGGGDSSTTILSTIATAYVGKKIFSGIAGIGRAFSGMYNTGKSFSNIPLSGGAVLGTGIKELGTNTAIRLGAGNLPGNASLSAGALSALGIGATVGTVVGGAGIYSGVKNIREAQRYQYDTAARNANLRTGATKIGMVGTGAAAGAAIGSIIPGVGTLVGAGIGAGVGGLGALLKGEAFSNFLGGLVNAKDRQQATLIEMGDDLQSAVNNYRDITENNDYAQALINDYQKLEEALSSDGLKDDEAVRIQEQMASIAGQLQSLFPDLISSYDTLNGKTGERIDLLQKEMDQMDAQAKMQLQQKVQDIKETLPELKEQQGDVAQQIETLQADWGEKNEYRTGLTEMLMDYQKISDNPMTTDEERSAAAEELIQNANNLSDQLGQGDYFSHVAGIIDARDSAKKETQGMVEELEELSNKKTELDNTMEEYYNGSVQLIASDHKVNTSELLAKVNELNVLKEGMTQLSEKGSLATDTQEKLNEIVPGLAENTGTAADKSKMLADRIADIIKQVGPAIEQIQQLNTELENLPDEKKVTLSFDMQSALQNQQEYNMGVPGSYKMPDIKDVTSDYQIPHRAEGGFVNGPEYSLIGEDGPEVIIPVGGKRRMRGLSLWERAGQLLGVRGYADGGIVNAPENTFPMEYGEMISNEGIFEPDGNESVQGNDYSSTLSYSQNQNTSQSPVTVKVEMEPSFVIQIQEKSGEDDGEKIMDVIRKNMNTLANDLSETIASKLADVFANMPANS